MLLYSFIHVIEIFLWFIVGILPAGTSYPWPSGVTDALTTFGTLIAGVADILPAGVLASMGLAMAFLVVWKLWLLPFIFGRMLLKPVGAAYDDPDLLAAWEQDQRDEYAKENAVYIGPDLRREFAADDDDDDDFEA